MRTTVRWAGQPPRRVPATRRGGLGRAGAHRRGDRGGAGLPAGARYLRRCGGAGLPRVGSFRAGVRDGAQTITAELVFDDAGDLVDFVSDDRPRTATGRRDRTSFAGPVRVEGPVARGGWGRPVPGR